MLNFQLLFDIKLAHEGIQMNTLIIRMKKFWLKRKKYLLLNHVNRMFKSCKIVGDAIVAICRLQICFRMLQQEKNEID